MNLFTDSLKVCEKFVRIDLLQMSLCEPWRLLFKSQCVPIPNGGASEEIIFKSLNYHWDLVSFICLGWHQMGSKTKMPAMLQATTCVHEFHIDENLMNDSVCINFNKTTKASINFFKNQDVVWNHQLLTSAIGTVLYSSIFFIFISRRTHDKFIEVRNSAGGYIRNGKRLVHSFYIIHTAGMFIVRTECNESKCSTTSSSSHVVRVT